MQPTRSLVAESDVTDGAGLAHDGVVVLTDPTCSPGPRIAHTSGFKMGAPYGEGSANFEAMREWNHAVIYRKTIAYFADQLVGQ